MEYEAFLAAKSRSAEPVGFEPDPARFPKATKPFQAAVTTWGCRRGRAALFEGTGLGKTLQELTWAQEVRHETKRPVLALTPLAVAEQTVMEAEKFGIDGVAYADEQDAARTPIVVTNYDRLHLFDPSKFGGVVLDECFAPDTQIDVIDQSGKRYKKRIENVRVGDRIWNAAGADIVSDIHRREVFYGVRVRYAGQEVLCSPNHPFFTWRGWVGAQDLEPGDAIIRTEHAVRMVQDSLCAKATAGQGEVLRAILLSEMADEPAGERSEVAHAGGCRKEGSQETRVVCQRRPQGRRRDQAHHRTQPHVSARSAREALPPIESHEARTFRAWGERARFDEAASGDVACAYRDVGGGICLVTGPAHGRLSNALQDRLSRRRAENRHRSGWSLPHVKTSARCEEGRSAHFFRVESIEVLERGDPGLDRYVDEAGKLYFYDLGGTRHPSFSIHGGLVHNSSILKAADGKTRAALMEWCAEIPYLLPASATPAPNDWTELGQHSELLGVMSAKEMLAMYFVHDGSNRAHGGDGWRLKRHAEDEFWRWVASWAVMIRKPADLGFEEDGYDLPPLVRHQVTVASGSGDLWDELSRGEVVTLSDRIHERRASMPKRVGAAAEIARASRDRPWVHWCNLNDEADAMVREIPGAVQVAGSDPREEKKAKLIAFSRGEIQDLVTKPSIAGFGMNWQHCHSFTCVGLNDSFEQLYQLIRRFWRYGQQSTVDGYFIASDREGPVVKNLERKERDYEAMADAMAAHMREFNSAALRGGRVAAPLQHPTQRMELPSWMVA